MDIIKNKVEEIMIKIGYTCQEKCSDKQLNTLFSYWVFLMKRKKKFRNY